MGQGKVGDHEPINISRFGSAGLGPQTRSTEIPRLYNRCVYLLYSLLFLWR